MKSIFRQGLPVYAVQNALGTADSMMAGTPVRVQIHLDGKSDVPTSYTDGREVHIPAPKAVEDPYLLIEGYNQHELAHVLYTEFSNTARALKASESRVHNILEDNRIELRFAQEYPGTEYLFTYLINTAIIQQEQFGQGPALNTYFLLSHRRVDSSIRKLFRERSVRKHGAEVVNQLDKLLQEYMPLDVSVVSDYQESIRITQAVTKLLQENGCTPPESTDSSSACSSQHTTEGSPESGAGAAGSESDDAVKAGIRAQVAQDQSDTESAEAANPKSVVKQAAEDAAAVAEEHSDSSKELEAAATEAEAVSDGTQSPGTDGGDFAELRTTAASAKAISAARKFGNEMRRLVRMVAPGKVRYLPSGSELNVPHVITGGAVSEAFNRWQPGNARASSIECVILVDFSQSMSYRANVGSFEQAWVIQEGLRSLNRDQVNVHVFGFNTEHRLLSTKKYSSRSNFVYPVATGGTSPLSGLRVAERIFKKSSAQNKLLFILTDGAWRDSAASESVISAMNSKKVVTALFDFSEDDMGTGDQHECQLMFPITDMENFSYIGKRVVKQAINSASLS